MYTFSLTLNMPFGEAIDRVKEALSDEGFGVLTEIDLAATMKSKLDETIPAYTILGACNPPLAFEAIQAEPTIGALLPCNVVVRQGEHEVTVDFMDPAAAMSLAESPSISDLGARVRQKLERVAHSLAPEVVT